MTVSGTIDKIRYANNGFAVVIITDDDGKSHCLSGRIYDPEVFNETINEQICENAESYPIPSTANGIPFFPQL